MSKSFGLAFENMHLTEKNQSHQKMNQKLIIKYKFCTYDMNFFHCMHRCELRRNKMQTSITTFFL